MSKKIYKSLGDYSVDIDELLRTTGYIIEKNLINSQYFILN